MIHEAKAIRIAKMLDEQHKKKHPNAVEECDYCNLLKVLEQDDTDTEVPTCNFNANIQHLFSIRDTILLDNYGKLGRMRNMFRHPVRDQMKIKAPFRVRRQVGPVGYRMLQVFAGRTYRNLGVIWPYIAACLRQRIVPKR